VRFIFPKVDLVDRTKVVIIASLFICNKIIKCLYTFYRVNTQTAMLHGRQAVKCTCCCQGNTLTSLVSCSLCEQLHIFVLIFVTDATARYFGSAASLIARVVRTSSITSSTFRTSKIETVEAMKNNPLAY
jgi:hypothetical protein